MDGAASARGGAVTWFARIAVASVFAVNIDCALAFLLRPEIYAGGFELSGVPGVTAVRSLGVLFLMWNATYPPVIWQPGRFTALFAVVLAQQAIGLVGETALLLALPAGHAALTSAITRFIVFDASGLVLMLAAFVLLLRSRGAQR